jgi:dipeptidyl aminopeptidase/acylaminoacyl peptidase
MMRPMLFLMLALAGSTALAKPIPAPERRLSDPRALTSPANPAARPVPLEDLVLSRNVGSVAWGPDGNQIFLVTNLTGRMNIWRTDAAGRWPVQLTQSDDVQTNLRVSPDGRTLFYAQDAGGNEDHDLYAVPTAGGSPVNLTNTLGKREVSMIVAPDGRTLAFSTKLKSEGQVNLAVMDVGTRQVRALTAERDPQLRWSPVGWIEGGRALIANRGNANSTQNEIWRVDAATGQATKLAGRKGARIIAEDVTADGRTVAVSSDEANGQLRAGLYDVAAKRWRWLKPTPWEQTAEALSPDGRNMVVRTGVDGRSALSLVDVASAAERPLALPPGLNAVIADPFAPDSRRLLVTHAGADTPADLHLADIATGTATPLTRMAMASLDPAILPKSEVVTYRSFDGTPISAIVTVPFNLRRDGSNPGIVIPHGGPTGQSQDGFNRTATALASRGYVVIQPNFRGSTGYGKVFQTANFKDLGGGDLKDTVAARDFLVATGYVDPKRVGITGGSYGGFMTLMALGRAPDAFAAGVQHYGIINWYTMHQNADPLLKEYIVSLIGDPVKDKAVYDAASPMTYLAKARAPLLSLQGENDIRVPRGQAQEVADMLKAQGATTETIFYAAEGHGFQKRENQIDALRRTVEWFDRHLKGAPAMASAGR